MPIRPVTFLVFLSLITTGPVFPSEFFAVDDRRGAFEDAIETVRNSVEALRGTHCRWQMQSRKPIRTFLSSGLQIQSGLPRRDGTFGIHWPVQIESTNFRDRGRYDITLFGGDDWVSTWTPMAEEESSLGATTTIYSDGRRVDLRNPNTEVASVDSVKQSEQLFGGEAWPQHPSPIDLLSTWGYEGFDLVALHQNRLIEVRAAYQMRDGESFGQRYLFEIESDATKWPDALLRSFGMNDSRDGLGSISGEVEVEQGVGLTRSWAVVRSTGRGREIRVAYDSGVELRSEHPGIIQIGNIVNPDRRLADGRIDRLNQLLAVIPENEGEETKIEDLGAEAFMVEHDFRPEWSSLRSLSDGEEPPTLSTFGVPEDIGTSKARSPSGGRPFVVLAVLVVVVVAAGFIFRGRLPI